VPADMVLIRTSERAGTCFIRTDQLDGETDWKLRLAVPSTQRLMSDMVLTVLITVEIFTLTVYMCECLCNLNELIIL